MFNKQAIRVAVGSALAALALGASAAPITLTFEGLADGASVGNFYNGGGGTNYGVSFSPQTLALIDADAGGTGNFANEPTANTVMFFLDATSAVLNYAAGFDTGFSFFYSSAVTATVNVYSGLNATGSLLGTITLAAQNGVGCSGDPTGTYCNWSVGQVAFSGIARSIDFGGSANFTGYDNITFGSIDPNIPTPAPEPGSIALVGAALLGLAAARRRR